MGGDDYVNCHDDPSLHILGDITIEAWVKLTTLGPYQFIISHQQGSSLSLYNLYVRATNGRLSFNCYTTDGNQWAQAPADITDGLWHHCIGIRDATHMRVFLDTVEYARPWSGTVVPSPGDAFIGARPDGPAYHFDGLIDEPAIYNRVLSIEQIKDHYGRREPV